MEEHDITKADIEKKLSFDKSQLSRYWKGRNTMSLERFFEINEAIGFYKPIDLGNGTTVTINRK